MAIQGGRSPQGLPNYRYFLTKPYDMDGDITAEKWEQLNQMLTELYDAGRIITTSFEEGQVLDSETGEVADTSEASGDDSASAIRVAVTDLAAADIYTLNTVPVEIVPAGGAGIIRVPIMAATYGNVLVAFSATTTVTIRYTNATTVVPSTAVNIVTAAATGPRYTQKSANGDAAIADVANSALEFVATGANTTGTLTNDILRVYVVYYELTAPYNP